MTNCACCERDIGSIIFEGLNNDAVCFQCRGGIVLDDGPYRLGIKNFLLMAKIESYIRKYKGVSNDTTQ